MKQNKYTPERLLLLLVLITIVVVVFREPLLEQRLLITPQDPELRFELDSDIQDGGDTQVEWLDKEKLTWQCQLGGQWPYPFCAMQIYFSDSFMQGRDLSRYTHFNLRLEYEGSARSYRLFLRNANPAYTKAGEIRSTKFNGVELDLQQGPEYRDLPTSYFRVADWWLQLYNLDVHLAQEEFTNVGLIEIQSGTGLRNGRHQFKLDYIELVGARVEVESLYLGIILVWIAAILLYLGARVHTLKLAVRVGQEKQAELAQVNALLDKRRQTLEERNKLDPLTGAYNRAGIEDSLADAYSKWRIKQKPFSLLLIDVDHFKAINDNHGHAVGDSVLRELTTLISDHIRGEDRLARWGGEEFIIVCDNTAMPQAMTMAEKVRQVVSGATFAGSLQVTVSIGVAQVRRNEDLDQPFDRADKALYAAKEQGRNRVLPAAAG